MSLIISAFIRELDTKIYIYESRNEGKLSVSYPECIAIDDTSLYNLISESTALTITRLIMNVLLYLSMILSASTGKLGYS